MKRKLTLLCIVLSLLAPVVMAWDAQPLQAQKIWQEMKDGKGKKPKPPPPKPSGPDKSEDE